VAGWTGNSRVTSQGTALPARNLLCWLHPVFWAFKSEGNTRQNRITFQTTKLYWKGCFLTVRTEHYFPPRMAYFAGRAYVASYGIYAISRVGIKGVYSSDYVARAARGPVSACRFCRSSLRPTSVGPDFGPRSARSQPWGAGHHLSFATALSALRSRSSRSRASLWALWFFQLRKSPMWRVRRRLAAQAC